MKITLALISIIILSSTSNAHACSPSISPPSIDDSVNNSSLIIIGKRAKNQKYIDYDFNGNDSPRHIKVIKVLKGTLHSKTITVSGSWGMCGIAFNFKDQDSHVLFLNKAKADSQADYISAGSYNSINSLKVTDSNSLIIDGKKIILKDANQ